MNLFAKIVLYGLLAVATMFFAHRFFTAFSQRMNQSASQRSASFDRADDARSPAEAAAPDTAVTNPAASDQTNVMAGATGHQSGPGATNARPATASPPTAPAGKSPLVAVWGFLALLTLLSLGLLVGNEVSQYIAQRVHRELYSDEGGDMADPLYEQAEQVWANGDHLEAVRLMREYLQANPRRLHVALRIAEIYEKDLNNHLAAALEYEEVLQHKFDPERWGWAAVHLCNLYNRLNQPQKAEALLHRVVGECAGTGPAKKAREHLGLPPEDPEGADEGGPSAVEAAGQEKLPPGFKRKRG
jgi:tetratricopeptide (TPR) repeat protein